MEIKVIWVQVREVMTDALALVSAEASLRQAASLMCRQGEEVLAVVRGRKIVGTLSRRDLSRARQGRRPGTVAEAMNDRVVYCFENEDLDETLAAMCELAQWHFVVVDQTRAPVGLVSLRDVAAVADDSPSPAGTDANLLRSFR